jgi:hypothetical protein
MEHGVGLVKAIHTDAVEAVTEQNLKYHTMDMARAAGLKVSLTKSSTIAN